VEVFLGRSLSVLPIFRNENKMTEFWLDPIPDVLRDRAIEALKRRDIQFLIYAENTVGLELVIHNMSYLIESGIYEEALLDAYNSTRTNLSKYPMGELRWLFGKADRAKLLQIGDQLPDQESFVAYRGVSGRGRARRVRGFSWTASLETAHWFANWFARLGDPAVYRVKFTKDTVLAYINERNEQEFILSPDRLQPKRLMLQCCGCYQAFRRLELHNYGLTIPGAKTAKG
jgi:hypothetical protein